MKHLAPPQPAAARRRWLTLWVSSEDEGAMTIDLRSRPDHDALPDDPDSVIARLARLRDARLLSAAEFERERRAILGASSAVRGGAAAR